MRREPPVRSEVLDVLRRLDPFRDDPDPLVAGLAELSPRDRDLLATATEAELRMGARDAVRVFAGSADWSYLWPQTGPGAPGRASVKRLTVRLAVLVAVIVGGTFLLRLVFQQQLD